MSMYPRINYEMTEADLNAILDACKATPVMMIGGYCGSSPQENANRAWAALGEKMGFDAMTVQPVQGKGNRFFSAVPNETEEQKATRLAREKSAAVQDEICTLDREIGERQQRLDALRRLAGEGDGT